ncbi:hypothetical protein [Halobacillus sp. K22]|uniref:hypothetical protein n=1 Tax=Halobacillus sp. K22 TaxID=3457431 RepID=UPI003FCE0B4B
MENYEPLTVKYLVGFGLLFNQSRAEEHSGESICALPVLSKEVLLMMGQVIAC